MKKLLAIFIALLFASNSFAASGKVVVVTSFPKDLSGKFKAAFEKKYPGVTVEVVGKKLLLELNTFRKQNQIMEQIFFGLPHQMRLKF